MHKFVHTCICTHIYIHMHIHTSVHTCICTYIYTHTWMHIHVYAPISKKDSNQPPLNPAPDDFLSDFRKVILSGCPSEARLTVE